MMDKSDLSASQIFAGIAFGGGKTDKACVAILEYYPKQNRIFLLKLYERIRSDAEISADQKVFELLGSFQGRLVNVAFDVPWRLPQCLRCQIPCPGFETCKEPHIQWFWQKYREHHLRKRPKRLFTPYTQRCVEMAAVSDFEIPFPMSHAMGANSAPLMARAAFLARRLSVPIIEVFPEASVWRIGHHLKINRSVLMNFKKAVDGESCRRTILQTFVREKVSFFYESDLPILVEHIPAFQAFICAYTGYLSSLNKTEPRPSDFPRGEDWIEIPK